MADYQDIADSLEESAAEGLVESYRVGSNFREVKRGPILDQLKALSYAKAMAARAAGSGIFRLAKPRNPS